jgi:hypothetical protein
MRWARLLALLVLVGLLTGCATVVRGAPTVAGTGPAGGPDAPVAQDAAPPVPHPLNADAMVKKPCSALTPAQVAALKIVPIDVDVSADALGTGCTWTSHQPGTGVDVGWLTYGARGLAGLYAQRSQQAYWQPATVSGYPAVYADGEDQRSVGDCVVAVGVTRQLYFFVEYTIGPLGSIPASPTNSTESCGRAKQTAADVIQNLLAH